MNDRQEELDWQQRAIERARAGDEESAWIVLRAIMIELGNRYHDCAPLKGFTAFIQALLDLKDAVGHGSVPREQLGALLKTLGITRSRGERKVKDVAWDELAGVVLALHADESPVLRRAAAFVEALLLVKNSAKNFVPSRDELVCAFDTLNILPDPGRPPTGYRELLGRISAERLERLKGKSVAEARAALDAGEHRLSASRQGDIHTEHPDLVDLVDGLSRKELEGLASNLGPKK